MPDSSAPSHLAEMTAEAVRHVRSVSHELVVPSFGPDAEHLHEWLSETQVHTQADAQAGEEFERRFSASFPGHGLVIEDRAEVPGDGRHVWYVDPIDGSANHLRGIPYVAVTVGLMLDGKPAVGVVHDVVRDVTVCAYTGGGARRLDPGDPVDAGTPLHVPPVRELSDAVVIAHLSRRGPLLGVEGALQHILWRIRKIRCMGSIALDLSLLACGEADLLVVGRGRPQRMLDILGGMVVLREAGGRICTAEGHPVTPETRTLIAGPPPLCEAFVRDLTDFDLEGWTSDMARPPTSTARPGA